MFFELLVASIAFIGRIESASLPPYITPCSLSDIEFEKCALSTAKSFFQYLKQGSKDFSVPPIGHIKFPVLYFNNSKNININATDVSITGVEGAKFFSLKKIPSKNRIEASLKNSPSLTGNFIINSKVGDVSLVGNGPGIWNVGEVKVDIALEFQPKERDGVNYTDITNVETKVAINGSSLNINVDPGNNLNELISRNIEEITKEIIPSGVYYAKRIFTILTHSIFTSVPYDEIFLE